jgi:hypothetical protein
MMTCALAEETGFRFFMMPFFPFHGFECQMSRSPASQPHGHTCGQQTKPSAATQADAQEPHGAETAIYLIR